MGIGIKKLVKLFEDGNIEVTFPKHNFKIQITTIKGTDKTNKQQSIDKNSGSRAPNIVISKPTE